jgi:hypothetical protein
MYELENNEIEAGNQMKKGKFLLGKNTYNANSTA